MMDRSPHESRVFEANVDVYNVSENFLEWFGIIIVVLSAPLTAERNGNHFRNFTYFLPSSSGL